MTRLAEVAASRARTRLEQALIKAGAVITDAELELIATEFAYSRASDAAGAWKSLLPPESERMGIALPYMVTARVEDFASIGAAILGYVMAYFRDEAGSLSFRNWIDSDHVRGEYFTGADPGAGADMYAVLRTIEDIVVTRGLGGKLWDLLGLEASDISRESVGLTSRIRQRDTTTAGRRDTSGKFVGAQGTNPFEQDIINEVEK